MTVVMEQQKKASPGLRPIRVMDMGLIPYVECWDLQTMTARDVGDQVAPEALMLLEHPHTYTCGKRGGRENILVTPDELEELRATVIDVDRGGDITYHGPGQLVAYPIINLREYGEVIDYPAYIRRLEDVLIGSLADFGISAGRVKFLSGAWVLSGAVPEKIAAIGVKVDARGVTTHGIALNVNTDLSYFDRIVPCGIRGKGVTSMRRVKAEDLDMDEVKACLVMHFQRVFGFVQLVNRA